MPAIVADTHTIIWYLADDPRLSPSAAGALDRASALTAQQFRTSRIG
jgi:PIN domain nuclease of toxin-antitoxin system